MDSPDTQYRVRQCDKCSGDTEYYCETCSCDLCPQCKENHMNDLKTIDHNVKTKRERLTYIPKEGICVRHPRRVCRKYCEPCQVPVCKSCKYHRHHKKLYIRTAYKTMHQQHGGVVHSIKRGALFYTTVLLSGIKADVETCRAEFSFHKSKMLTKAQKIKDFMAYGLRDIDFKHRFLKQMIEMSRHIVSLQEYELRYIQPEFTFSALQFLSFTKTALPQIHLTLHTSQLSMTESLNKEGVMESLSGIRITERGNRRVENECLLQLMACPELHLSFKVKVVGCDHISCVTSDQVYVSDNANIILANTTGNTLLELGYLPGGYYKGLHTVDKNRALFYIDRHSNINKVTPDSTNIARFIKTTDSEWLPRCLYWSPYTGDLLVGMYRNNPRTGKVVRYDQIGQIRQIIQSYKTRQKLYKYPIYITENSNGDIVVSDYDSQAGAIVVTDCLGRHRFSYTGHPSGSGLQPCGICTDALSHILLCEELTKTVQMLDKDGLFLSHILIRPPGILKPHSLSYDVNTHRLWVGSQLSERLCVYRYLDRQNTLKASADVMKSLGENITKTTEKPQEKNELVLELFSPPELLATYEVTGVVGCYHISCLTPEEVLISDKYKNIILSGQEEKPLYLNICESYGIHTVNSRREMIFLDGNHCLNKLPNDLNDSEVLNELKPTPIFIETPVSRLKPKCVYSSQISGDLLVGISTKVTRYNRNGQLIQTIQHDNTGLELYSDPLYITENNNGDVVVSDSFSAVVVTERGGRYRFSYTGHILGSGLKPWGICTDPLSNILVCDDRNESVHVLDKDGQFLSFLEIDSEEMVRPLSLSYDVNYQCLWVGFYNNKIGIYRYITNHDALEDECDDD